MDNIKEKIIIILFIIGIILYINNREYVLNHLYDNLQEYHEYQQQKEISTEEKILSLYYLESLNEKNKEQVMDYVKKYYSHINPDTIQDNTLRKFLLDCKNKN